MCFCGDIRCPSCGPAQGNEHCPECGQWADEGLCEHMIAEREVDPHGSPVGVGAVLTVLVADASLTEEKARLTALGEVVTQYNPDFVKVLGIRTTLGGWAVRLELFKADPARK